MARLASFGAMGQWSSSSIVFAWSREWRLTAASMSVGFRSKTRCNSIAAFSFNTSGEGCVSCGLTRLLMLLLDRESVQWGRDDGFLGSQVEPQHAVPGEVQVRLV